MTPKQQLWAMLEALPMLSDDQRLYIVLVAHGETAATYLPTAHNDTPDEVAASERAWDSNPQLAQRLEKTGHPRAAWTIGSGGYGGRLVPYYGDDMLDAGLPCAPAGVFEPRTSLISSIVTAHKLQRLPAWRRSARRVANLRAGYYGLAYIVAPPIERVKKYSRHAAAALLPTGFVDRPLDEFPGPSQGRRMLACLEGVTL